MKIINLNQRGKYGSAKDKALSPNKRDEVYKNIRDQTDKVIFILSAYAGLRVGEIEQMRSEWIERTHFNKKEVLAINIPAEDRNIKNKKMIWRPKTRRQRTTYIFDKELFLEVETYFRHYPLIKLSIRSIQNRVYKMCGVSIHSLRATAQNYYKYELQLPTEIIAVMLGHRDVRTTLQHYTTLNKAQAESYLVNKFGDDK